MLRLAVQAMGTRFELVIPGDGAERFRPVAEEALREVELWHDRLSRFQPESDIARLNREVGGPVDDELLALFVLCDQARLATSGGFDIVRPDRTLDLGGIAKGFALDRAARILLDHGVASALMHGGTSSVLAIGSAPGCDGWPVRVTSLGAPIKGRLRDAALSVSAQRERNLHHIINPTTGVPAALADTACVVAPLELDNAGALCEAWSTALLVLGHRLADTPAPLETHIHTPSGWHSSPTPEPLPA